MVAIPNHHFFRWANQLEQSGYEVFWFDVSSSGSNSPQIPWVTQFTNWKLKWDFPFRTRIKKQLPALQPILTKVNEVDVNKAFKKVLEKVKPDVIHCFEMKLSIKPIFKTLKTAENIPLIYSSWGSDIYAYDTLGITQEEFKTYLHRVNFLITDCKRDYEIAKDNGFKNNFLGVFPGNGGIEIKTDCIKSVQERELIIVKGYEDGVGKAIHVLKAIESLVDIIKHNFRIVVYSADDSVADYISSSEALKKIDVPIYSRYTFILNKTLLELMGQSRIHVANSIADGMPNSLLEAMSMGSFPIQSNPGSVTEEVINHGVNGYLINNPLDVDEISEHIKSAINNLDMLQSAKNYNVDFMLKNYNRSTLQPKIKQLYQTVVN